MKIEFYTQFEKQLDRVADGPLKAKVAHIVSQVIQSDSLSEIIMGWNYYANSKLSAATITSLRFQSGTFFIS
jgi:hypothetical protein